MLWNLSFNPTMHHPSSYPTLGSTSTPPLITGFNPNAVPSPTQSESPAPILHPFPTPRVLPSVSSSNPPVSSVCGCRLRSIEAAEDRFELRLEGWRKFHMVALSDLLASEDSIDGG